MNDAGGSVAAERYSDRYFTVHDGLRLHYRDYPGAEERPPLLCLPGLTRNSRDFADFAERYSPAFRVIALEFRGRAGSDYDPVPARYNPMTYAGDVIELLDQLGHRPARRHLEARRLARKVEIGDPSPRGDRRQRPERALIDRPAGGHAHRHR